MSFEKFTRIVTEFYKDDVENIYKWERVYKIFNEKVFTSVEDCTKDKVELYIKERETHEVFLKFIINEGKTLKRECPEAIEALAKVLESNPEQRAEMRFMFFFLQTEHIMDKTDTRNFNSVLDIATLFKKKDSNQKMYVELTRQYSMIISNSIPSKSQKTSVNQNYPVEALIKKMKDDLEKSAESYENPTFYNKKHKSMIDLMEKLKEKLKISEKQIQMLESGCKDKSLFVPYGMGFSPLLESVERDAREFGWVPPAPEQINELTQVPLKPPEEKNTDQLISELLENIESHKSRDSNGNGGDDDGDSYGNTSGWKPESKNLGKSGSSVSVDKGFNSDSSDDGYSSDEGDEKNSLKSVAV